MKSKCNQSFSFYCCFSKLMSNIEIFKKTKNFVLNIHGNRKKIMRKIY